MTRPSDRGDGIAPPPEAARVRGTGGRWFSRPQAVIVGLALSGVAYSVALVAVRLIIVPRQLVLEVGVIAATLLAGPFAGAAAVVASLVALLYPGRAGSDSSTEVASQLAMAIGTGLVLLVPVVAITHLQRSRARERRRIRELEPEVELMRRRLEADAAQLDGRDASLQVLRQQVELLSERNQLLTRVGEIQDGHLREFWSAIDGAVADAIRLLPRRRDDDPVSHAPRPEVSIAQAALGTLERTFADVPDFWQLRDEAAEENARSLDLATVCRDLCDLMQAPAFLRGSYLELDWPAGVPRFVRGNRAQIRFFVLAAILHALELPRRRTICIRAEGTLRAGGRVEIVLSVDSSPLAGDATSGRPAEVAESSSDASAEQISQRGMLAKRLAESLGASWESRTTEDGELRSAARLELKVDSGRRRFADISSWSRINGVLAIAAPSSIGSMLHECVRGCHAWLDTEEIAQAAIAMHHAGGHRPYRVVIVFDARRDELGAWLSLLLAVPAPRRTRLILVGPVRSMRAEIEARGVEVAGVVQDARNLAELEREIAACLGDEIGMRSGSGIGT